MGKLKSLMNTLFKMKLANNDQTFVSKKILYDPDMIALNQESTISQLLGSTFFYSITEDRKFCLKYIYLILKKENLEIDLEKVKDWEKNKNDFENICSQINSDLYIRDINEKL